MDTSLTVNSSETAYLKLRERILNGELKAGVALKERDLCQELGISRTPVREALRRLSADGLVDTAPRRSIRVARISEEELAEIAELGSVLQPYVAALAAQKATAADIAELKRLNAAMTKLVESGRRGAEIEYARLDHAFHDRIAEMARNSRITQIIRQTVSLRLLTNFMDQYGKVDFHKSLRDHTKILKAIADGDSEGARAAMSDHVGKWSSAAADG